jgi:hypothetical protein
MNKILIPCTVVKNKISSIDKLTLEKFSFRDGDVVFIKLVNDVFDFRMKADDISNFLEMIDVSGIELEFVTAHTNSYSIKKVTFSITENTVEISIPELHIILLKTILKSLLEKMS